MQILVRLFLVRFCVLTFLGLPVSVKANTEIWLISGPECNTCSLYEEVQKLHNYQDYLIVDDKRYKIRNIDKLNIPKDVSAHFEEFAKNDSDWPLQLTVAVVDSGDIIYSANIAESVDWGGALVDQKYMNPPAIETLENLHDYGFDYGKHLKQNINLEYFIEKASNPELSDFNREKIKLSPLKKKNSIKASVWGTALQPANNALFISTRIKELQSLFRTESIFTVYANGKDHTIRDVLIKRGDKFKFIASKVSAQFSSDFSGLGKWFSHIANSSHNSHLIVQVGHHGPIGIPVWGNALPVNAEELASAIDETKKDVIFVSGACHSGLLANVGQCGFYAAHPQAVATGCQVSLKAIEASDDYLKYFFLASNKKADANNDRLISFSEAHWFAASQLETHNIVYSDTDTEVENYFSENPEKLLRSMKIKKLAELVTALSPEEQFAFRVLSKNLDDKLELDLSNYVELHKQSIEKLEGYTEESSHERNKITSLKYHLNLVVLARRALFFNAKQKFNSNTVACGKQSITEYVPLSALEKERNKGQRNRGRKE